MTVDIKSIHDHYISYSEKYGATSQGVACGSNEERIASRYRCLVSKIPFNKDKLTLLDVGSGYGGIIQYMPADAVEYTGIDITESSVLHGRELYPQYEFIHDDFLSCKFDREFDVVICSGAFNVKMELSDRDMFSFLSSMVLKMYSLSKKMTVFNMMSNRVNFFSKGMFYKSPVEMLSWCFDNVCDKIDIDHSSISYEYTITLKK